jgi:zinc/manganese transport system substrate-binding protein
MKQLGRFVAVLFLLCAPGVHAAVNVFACEPEWASLAQELGGNLVETYSATTARQDPHHVEARPSLIAKMRRADLLICTGADLEAGWLPLLLRQAGNEKVQPGRPGHFMAADFVDKLEVPTRLDRSQGDIHAQGNPHLHTDPRRVLKVAQALAARMVQVSPGEATVIGERAADFEQRWQSAMARWQQRAAPLRGVRAVSQHQDWVYLYDWLGMVEAGRLEPKPGIPPSAAHLAELKARLAATPARMVLRTGYQDSRPSQWLRQHAGVKAVELPYTVGGDPQATDLFQLMDLTLDRLLGALQ